MTRLEFLRRTAGMDQMGLAVRIGCHSSLISKLERGWRTSVSPEIERKLSRVFRGWKFSQLLQPVPELQLPAEPQPEERSQSC